MTDFDKQIEALVSAEFIARTEDLLSNAKIEACVSDYGREFFVSSGEFAGIGATPSVAMADLAKTALRFWLNGEDGEAKVRSEAVVLN